MPGAIFPRRNAARAGDSKIDSRVSIEPMSIDIGRQWIEQARNVVGFTGAGISTESGIPDFRSPNGVWARNRTVYFDEFVRDEAGRIEYWRQKAESWPDMRDARPNAGHLAFVTLARQGKLKAMITQNIDGLHHASGLDPALVHELHGKGTVASCLSCGGRIAMDEAIGRINQGERAPKCRLCGGLLKPATISFGQPMPQDVLEKCQRAAESCDVFLAVGSSLVVYPAAALPVVAKRAGARLIILNRTETPLDKMADLVIHDEIGKTLPALAGLELPKNV
jgi:NAD-dependent deacetylase